MFQKKRISVVLTFMIGSFLLLTGSLISAATFTIERISVSSGGVQANWYSYSYNGCISADGRYVAFQSVADNLVTGDTNSASDVFVRDRQMRTTERISVSSSGVEANSYSYNPVLSADGRYVAFYSFADNLVPGDTMGYFDVFVRDRQTGTIERISVSSSGVQGDGNSDSPSMSADGRYVAFASDATNLVTNDINAKSDVFVHDRQNGTTEIISLDSGGAQGDNRSYYPSISADGRYVAFYSDATNLAPGNTNGWGNIFVRDRQTGTTEQVSVDSTGVQGDGDSYAPSINADGRYVVFESHANLVSGGPNGPYDIFMRDRQTGTITRVSVDSGGVQGDNSSFNSSISGNGRYVVFHSYASNLVLGDTNGKVDIFIRDLRAEKTVRVSVDSSGAEANNNSAYPSINADGRYVTFASEATNLVTNDTNGWWDIFAISNPLYIVPDLKQSPPRNYYTALPITLTWSRVTWAISYEVQVSSSLAFTNPQIWEVSGSDLQTQIDTLQPGTYYWRVRAKTALGTWSPVWSSVDSFILAPP